MITGKGQVDCFRGRGEKHKRDVDIHPARHRNLCILFLIFKFTDILLFKMLIILLWNLGGIFLL